MKFSVVIITKNEAPIIERTIQNIQGITDDIVVVDSGSTDETQQLCRDNNASVYITEWTGYGATKNKGLALAAHDWILATDADEMPDATLKNALENLEEPDSNIAYKIQFKNFYGTRQIRFGNWGYDAHIRIFNRKLVQWNSSLVHEGLTLPSDVIIKTLPGYINHYTHRDTDHYISKLRNYARLCASQYFNQGRKSNFSRQYIGAALSFIHGYIVKFGFLDGRAGFYLAKTDAWYTWLKYAYLKELWKSQPQKKITSWV